jgi:hypothetical protein
MKKYVPTLNEFLSTELITEGRRDTKKYQKTVKEIMTTLTNYEFEWDEDYDIWINQKNQKIDSDTFWIEVASDLEERDLKNNPDDPGILVFTNWNKKVDLIRTWNSVGDKYPVFVYSFKVDNKTIYFTVTDEEFKEKIKNLRRKAIDIFETFRTQEEQTNWFLVEDNDRIDMINKVFNLYFKKLKEKHKFIVRMYKDEFLHDIRISFNRRATTHKRGWDVKFPTRYEGIQKY